MKKRLKRFNLNSKLFLIWLFTTFVLLVVVILFVRFYFLLNHVFDVNVFSNQILTDCKSDLHRNLCYEKKLVNLAKDFPMEDIFQATREIQKQDPWYAYCHVLAHKVAGEEVKKSPNNWKDVILRCPTDMCSNGCIHGVFQQVYDKEFLSDDEINKAFPDLKSICNNNPKLSYLAATACYHALGHLFLYITNGNINKSLSLCTEAVSGEIKSGLLRYCDEGSFMQIFQPLDPDDQALVKNIQPKDSQAVKPFCSQFQGVSLGACWNQSWPLFKDQLKTPKGLIDLCSSSGVKNVDLCYSPIITIIVLQFNLDSVALHNYCSEFSILSPNLGKICFARVATRMIEIDIANLDKSINFCKNAPADSQNYCFSQIWNMSSLGNYSYKNSCHLLPNPWHDECVRKN